MLAFGAMPGRCCFLRVTHMQHTCMLSDTYTRMHLHTDAPGHYDASVTDTATRHLHPHPHAFTRGGAAFFTVVYTVQAFGLCSE